MALPNLHRGADLVDDQGMIRPSFRSSALTRPTWAARSTFNAGVRKMVRPSPFLVLPTSKVKVPVWRSSCRRRSPSTSRRRQPSV